jgi:MFS family permease
VDAQQHVNAVQPITVTEMRKWGYVRDVLGKEMKVSQSVMRKIGEVVKNNSRGLMLLGLVLGIIVNGGLVEKGGEDDSFWRAHKFAAGFIGAVAILMPALFGETLFKSLGGWLERKSTTCRQVLTSFVKNWAKHKTQTPATLHALFDELAANGDGKGELKITDQEAQMIVESIVSVSIVAQLA